MQERFCKAHLIIVLKNIKYYKLHHIVTEQTCGRTERNGNNWAQHHVQCEEDQSLGQRQDKRHRYNQTCDKNEAVFDNKRRQRRRAKRCRGDLDKYCTDAIWQRTWQNMLTWRRHSEAFARPRDETKATQC